MPIGILNNIPSLQAENELTLTSTALNNTLQQLSSGARINTGADDPAGLSIANGLQANISALTQSVSNANDGVGQLQLADGALAQVTNLLNTAVTLATESATGTVSNEQRTSIQAQYASILAEINRIGTATTYNGQEVFQSGTQTNLNAVTTANNGTTSPLTALTPLTPGDITTVTAGGQTFTYTATASGTADPNIVTGNVTGLTGGSALGNGATLTLTLGTSATSPTTTYTVGSGGATMAQLIAAINTGTTQGTGTNTVSVSTSNGGVGTGFEATLNPQGALQITDLGNHNDLAAAMTGGSTAVANQIATTGQDYTLSSNLLQTNGGQLAISRSASDVAYYAIGSAGATMAQLIQAINTGTSQTTGQANQGVTVTQHAGGAASTSNLTASLVGGNLVITDGTGGTLGTFSATETGAPNLNVVIGQAANLSNTAPTALTAGDVFTATRNGTQVTTYTVGTGGASINDLVNAINTGASIAGASSGSPNKITVGTSGGGVATGYSAQLVGAAGSQQLQVTDQTNANDLTFTESGAPLGGDVSQTNAGFTNAPGVDTVAVGSVFTVTRNGQTATYTVATAAQTVNTLAAVMAGTASSADITVAGNAAAEGGWDAQEVAVGANYALQITDATGESTLANPSSVSGGKVGATNLTWTTAYGGETAGGTTGFAAATTAGNQQLIFANNTNPVGGSTFTDSTTTPATVQNLINAINNDTTVGAKAALLNGLLQISDPQDRGDLAVTTTDPVLGASASGAATPLQNATTTSGATTNTNELVSNASSTVTAATSLTTNAVTQFTAGGRTFTFTANSTNGTTVGALIAAINNPNSDTAGLRAYINNGQLAVVDPNDYGDIAAGAGNTETALGTYTNPQTTGSTATNIFLSDSTAIGSSQIAVTIGGLSPTAISDGNGAHTVNLAVTDLSTQTDAQTALTLINQAISNVASTRGTLGASVNRLTAASNVINSQVENLTSAENTIMAADIPTDVAQLTKYSILEQTGISALAQANQQQQLVLKLLQ